MMIDMINVYYVLRAYPISLIQRFIENRNLETSKDVFLAEYFPLEAHRIFLCCKEKEKVLFLHWNLM